MITRLALRFGTLFFSLACVALAQVSDPHVTSWLTANSAKYARIYETTAKRTSSTDQSVTTWPSAGLTNNDTGSASYNGSTNVAKPTYSDIQRVAYSSNYVYILTTGLASYTMGNWLTPNAMTYQSWPLNRGVYHKIPRTPSIPTTKQLNHGSGGVLVNGVFVWENGDAQSYKNAATSGSASTPTSADISMSGDGIWNRLAGIAETFNFDPANGHEPSSGAYHNHVNPTALRYQLGDNVTYDATAKTYSEGGTPTKHSPILGWANDGLPIYGPYGYSDPNDPTSTIRRMTSGFVKRDGANGTIDLASTGRTTLPAWSQRVQGITIPLTTAQYGPTTTATYALGPVTKTCSVGTFAEDYEYLGDLGKTQGTDFDLNQQNVRFCKTPEYPSGTYAYFVSIDASGVTAFPDIINQEYFGSAAPGQGTVTSISESVTDYVDAGPAAAIMLTGAVAGSNVALSWNSAEGATYKVESSSDGVTYTPLSTTVTAGSGATTPLTTNYTATGSTNYYRVTLTALATYDTGGTFGTPVGKTATLLFGTASVAPTITTQPTSQTVNSGTSATFSVVATGTGTLTYQWNKASVAIPSATGASYTITSPTASDAGNYTVTVTNSVGSVTSNAVTLTVNAASVAPTITTAPAARTVNAGASVTFSVVASGTAPLSYQWYKGGSPLGGAATASYTIPSAQPSDTGNYSVTIANTSGTVTSAAAALTVNATGSAPTITTQPTSSSVTAGASITFAVVASGPGSFTYQWNKNGAPIGGATNASYTIPSTVVGDAGNYSVTVTNSAGSTASNVAALSVSASAVAPTITTPPASASANPGANVTFSVVASGTAPLTYQWQHNAAAIGGATGASYTLASAQSSDAGNYTVTVTNSAGSATSAAATLTITSATTAPTIATQPVSASVTTGSSATLTVVANGTAPLTYQWYKNSAVISGATAASYPITTTQTTDTGSYTVTVTNSAGSATSAAAQLTVANTTSAPAITTQPSAVSISVSGSATFTVVATGTAPLTYQWYKDGVALPGATAATEALSNVQTSDAGNYTVVVANSVGSVTSAAAALSLNLPATAPTITVQPASTAASVFSPATFTVVASGTPPPTYQWQKNGTTIFGATGASYTIPSVLGFDAADYTVVVTNASGTVTSTAATLTVSVSPVGPSVATQPVAATTDVGGSVTFSIVANGTAPLVYQWLKDSTSIPGATNASYAIASAQLTDAGTYYCVVGNDYGSAVSRTAALTVNPPVAPAITTAPAGAALRTGESTTFTVAATGTAPLTYQWFKDGNAIAGATSASYPVANAQTTDAGSYTVTITNVGGAITSAAVPLTVAVRPAVPPAITAAPASATVTVGAAAAFNVIAIGDAPLRYQWSKAGAAIAGATSATYTISNAQLSDAGSYAVTVLNNAGNVTSVAATLTVNLPPPPTLAAGIVNLAVRTRIGGTAGTPIIGFVLGGTGLGKKLILRAVGPTLIASFGLAAALPDPRLELIAGSTLVGSNDNWLATDADAMSAVGAFPLNPGSGDAALVRSLPPGVYSTPVSAPAGTSGVVLVEIYDGAPSDATARLVNASARAYVGTGDDVLIPAFTIAGDGTVKVLVRAIGPSLAQFGLPGTLVDPQITLYSGSTAIATNDNWGDAANAAAIATAATQNGAFALPPGSKDAVLLQSLPAGSYSAIVSGVSGQTGTVLVELYVVH